LNRKINFQDYKEIAGINKEHRKWCIKKGLDPVIVDSISKHQADYFEREDKIKLVGSLSSGRILKREKKPEEQIFNKQNFLKDCGIK